MKLTLAVTFVSLVLQAEPLPVRGIHLAAPKPAEMELATRFIEEALPKEGVNTLVLEFNYRFQSVTHPEVVDPDALSKEQVQSLAASCRKAGVRLIPMINLLGHQSWAKTTFGLLRAHPEFDETPGLYPNNEGIYCRSYCPRHPDVHKVVFAMMDELLDWTGADAFHAGMDEVFLLGESTCPRCRGTATATLFTEELKAIRDHLAANNRELWIWADRLIDGQVTGIGKWEASMNGTAPSLASLPQDIVLCDWHYESAHPTAPSFALQGYRVVSSPWRKPAVALGQLDLIHHTRAYASPAVSQRMLGILHTTWTGFGPFVNTYFKTPGEPVSVEATESVLTFKTLAGEWKR